MSFLQTLLLRRRFICELWAFRWRWSFFTLLIKSAFRVLKSPTLFSRCTNRLSSLLCLFDWFSWRPYAFKWWLPFESFLLSGLSSTDANLWVVLRLSLILQVLFSCTYSSLFASFNCLRSLQVGLIKVFCGHRLLFDNTGCHFLERSGSWLRYCDVFLGHNLNWSFPLLLDERSSIGATSCGWLFWRAAFSQHFRWTWIKAISSIRVRSFALLGIFIRLLGVLFLKLKRLDYKIAILDDELFFRLWHLNCFIFNIRCLAFFFSSRYRVFIYSFIAFSRDFIRSAQVIIIYLNLLGFLLFLCSQRFNHQDIATCILLAQTGFISLLWLLYTCDYLGWHRSRILVGNALLLSKWCVGQLWNSFIAQIIPAGCVWARHLPLKINRLFWKRAFAQLLCPLLVQNWHKAGLHEASDTANTRLKAFVMALNLCEPTIA